MQSQKGGLLVEIVVVVGIIVSSLAAILGGATTFLVTSQIVQQTSQATALAQEGLEIVRNYRDGTVWAVDGLGSPAIVVGTEYHPIISSGEWRFDPFDPAPGLGTIGEFTRKIVFSNVYRDIPSPPGSGDIDTTGGGTLDPDTVKATVTVSWQERQRSHKVELEAYFTNWNQ